MCDLLNLSHKAVVGTANKEQKNDLNWFIDHIDNFITSEIIAKYLFSLITYSFTVESSTKRFYCISQKSIHSACIMHVKTYVIEVACICHRDSLNFDRYITSTWQLIWLVWLHRVMYLNCNLIIYNIKYILDAKIVKGAQ